MTDPSVEVVSWYQLATIFAVFSGLVTAMLGFAWAFISKQNGKNSDAISSLRETIENHRIEVARTYATTETVVKIEERLTNSIDRMSDQLGHSLAQLAGRVETIFTEMMKVIASDRGD